MTADSSYRISFFGQVNVLELESGASCTNF